MVEATDALELDDPPLLRRLDRPAFRCVLFQEYYNRVRVHRAMDGATPDALAAATKHRSVRLDDYLWESYCGGLYLLPPAA